MTSFATELATPSVSDERTDTLPRLIYKDAAIMSCIKHRITDWENHWSQNCKRRQLLVCDSRKSGRSISSIEKFTRATLTRVLPWRQLLGDGLDADDWRRCSLSQRDDIGRRN